MSINLRAEETGLYQSHFPPAEFKARWEKVFDKIGKDAVAIVQGAPQVNGYIPFRQTNEFYYLSGIETPHSYILFDGRNRKVTLFLPARNERLERAEGKVLSANDPKLVKELTGVDAVMSTDSMTGIWMRSLLGRPAPVLYTPFSPAEGNAQSRGELLSANASVAADFWDGRLSRESHFIGLLRTRLPRVEIRDLTPILDELRVIKSPREIALVRRASQLAGLGLMEAMRSSKLGVFEYQLDAAARYVFLVNGARLEAYRSITAAGQKNIGNMHYYRNTSELYDGDLVLMDYAPDYGYYVTDICRIWPANGKYNNWQRELLGFILEYRNAILERIRPGVTAAQIMDEAKEAMENVFERTKFSKPAYERAARKLVESGGGVFSHQVGMAVHDVGRYRSNLLRPGIVFSVDPQMWVPEEGLYLRYEDTVVVTEDGVENFTDFLPSELDDIENLMKEEGIVQKVPPSP
jgi:Xaa-Pro aminopeptidase